MRGFGLVLAAATPRRRRQPPLQQARFERSLKMLPPAERLEQLCDYTAMAGAGQRCAPLPSWLLMLHHDLGADGDARVKVDNVVIDHPEASRGHRLADRLRRVGAVDAVDGRTDI
jgi:hypothetical protein